MAAEANAMKAEGNKALAAKDFDSAIEWYTKAIELDATNHVFFSNRSAAHLSKGDNDSALKDAEECVRIKPDWAKGYNRKGAAQHALGQLEEAAATYSKGLEVDPANAALKAALQSVREAAAKRAQPKSPFGPDMMARLAMNPKFRGYMQDPSYMAAIQQLQTNPQAIGNMQGDPRIMETIGFLLGIDLNNMSGGAGGAAGATADPTPAPKEPESVPEPEEELSPEEAEKRKTREESDAVKKQGNEAYKAKDFAKALELYEQAMKVDPSNILVLLNQAAVYFEQKKMDECIATCNDAIQRGRELMVDYAVIAKAYARIGNALVKQDKFDEAIKAYENSLLEKHEDSVYRRLKKLRVTAKKKAEEAYWDKDKAAAAKAEGNAAFKEGNWKVAMERYSEAIKRDPTNAVYYQNRATARSKVMDFAGALDDADTAIKKDPTYVKAYWRKGLIQSAMKEFHKAMETFKAGLAIDPSNVECRQGLDQVVGRINASMQTGEVDKERAARGMADPEVQAILRDPLVRQTLNDMQTSPDAARKAMADPEMAGKLQKLMAAGVLQMR